MKINEKLPKVTGVLVTISIINRQFFHIGETNLGGSNLLGILYGWALIISLIIVAGMITLTFPHCMSAFYFIKYSEEYRKYFKVPDKQWLAWDEQRG